MKARSLERLTERPKHLGILPRDIKVGRHGDETD